MIKTLPLYISILFILTTALGVYLFYRATKSSRMTLSILAAWLLLQAFMGLSGFYTVTDSMPPRFLFLVLPPLFLILALFFSSAGRVFLDSLDQKKLTYLHIVRVPVEIVLLLLFQHGLVPQLMTFEGRNFDILAGLSAPLVAYMGYSKGRLGREVLLTWNFICLGLLLNIVANGVLSAPTPFQKFAFEQPNRALLYFPFVWLPCCIVPVVLLSHLACIRQLLKQDSPAGVVESMS